MINNLPMVIDPAPPPALLPVEEERFAVAYAVTGNATKAAREAFSLSDTMPRRLVEQRGYDTAQLPRIVARVSALRVEAARVSTMTLEEHIADYEAALRTDPNELSSVEHVACRYCHGVGGAYQWRSWVEFADACLQATADKRPLPSSGGGVGYTQSEPNPSCDRCDGHGETVVRIADTRNLSRGARLLFDCAEQKPDGTIRINKHKLNELRMLYHRLRGDIVDRKDVRTQTVPYVPPLKDMSTDDALAMLESFKS